MPTLDKWEITKGVRQYHIALEPGDVGEYVLLPGDPARSDRVAKFLRNAELKASHREHRTFTGDYKGIKVSVCSTGMGCPSTAIAVEELANIGANTFVRVGSSAALRPEIKIGDIVISNGSMKNEGTSRFYVPECFPAVPDIGLTYLLTQVAKELTTDTEHHVYSGISASDDAFYSEGEWIQKLIKLGVQNVEMEASALFTIALLRGLRAACICGVSGNLNTGEVIYTTENTKLAAAWEMEIQIVLETIYRVEQAKNA